MGFLNAGPLEQTKAALQAQTLNENQKKLAERIEKKDWPGWKKQAHLNYLLQQGKEGAGKSLLESKDPLKSWQKSPRYKELLAHQVQDAETSWTLAGITIVVCGTLVFFFINAILRQLFVISFSVDAIVAAIAFALLLRNIMIQFSIAALYGSWKEYAWMDALSFLLAFLLKLWMPPNIDFSLFVFLISYFIQKRKIREMIRKSTGLM